jgi:hypothetical protein
MLITYTTNSLQTYILNIVSQAHFVWVRSRPLLFLACTTNNASWTFRSCCPLTRNRPNTLFIPSTGATNHMPRCHSHSFVTYTRIIVQYHPLTNRHAVLRARRVVRQHSNSLSIQKSGQLWWQVTMGEWQSLNLLALSGSLLYPCTYGTSASRLSSLYLHWK